MQSRKWEDVNEGEELPQLEFGPLTIRQFVMQVAGTRDFNPHHHNREWHKSTGNRDIIMTTPWHQALFARFVSDWCGPDSDFRSTTLQMLTPVCPGDKLTVSGRITKKYREGDDYRVDVEMASESQLGVASRSSATLAMPSQEGGEVKVLANPAKPTIEPDPQIPDSARAFLGKVSPKSPPSPYPISEAQIMYWTEMVENANPLYVDSDYARNSRHKGLIAPPMSLMVWTYGRPSQMSDVDAPDHKPWPPITEAAAATSQTFSLPDMKYTISTTSRQDYGVPLRPGDRVRTTSELVNCTPLKRTRLGSGHFVTNMQTYYNLRDEFVGTNLSTIFFYNTD